MEDLTTAGVSKLNGLGGWLILVILGLFAMLVLQLIQVYNIAQSFSMGTYMPAFGGILRFELIMGIVLVVVTIYLVYLFFKKDRRFPKYYVIFLLAGVAYVSLDYGLFSLMTIPVEAKKVVDNEMFQQIGRAIWSLLIWGSYIKKSKRVKATFIN